MTDELNKLCKELTHVDPHFRQNAVRFLSAKFIKEYSILKPEERNKIIDGLISKLDIGEESIEVKGVTVREFGKMAKILKEEETIKVFSKIINFITDENVEGKDIYVLCIKELLKEMNPTSCYVVGKTIIPQLINKGIQNNDITIRELSFDTFNDYINKFNFVLIKESDSIIKNKDLVYHCALDNLKLDSLTIKKICSTFLGSLSTILNKENLMLLLNDLTDRILKSKDLKSKIVYFNTISAIARNTSSKHADFFEKIYKTIKEYSSPKFLADNNTSTDDYNLSNEAAEAVLNLLEIYILKLTKVAKNHIDEIIKQNLLELMLYDPNYNYPEENFISTNKMEVEEENYDYDNYDDQPVDDDDSAWRVRRASVRCILSIIKSRISIDRDLAVNILKQLIIGLRDREQNTKLDIIHCINVLLKSYVIETELSHEELLKKKNTEDQSQQLDFTKKITSLENKTQHIFDLLSRLPKELATSNKTHKLAILKMIGSLALVETDELVNKLDSISSALESAFKDGTESALATIHIFNKLLKGISQSHNFINNINYFDESYKQILYFLSLGVNHNYYKVNIEAVNSLSMLVSAIYAVNGTEIKSSVNAQKNQKYTLDIYNLLLPKFKLNDLDQELKMAIVTAVGQLIMHFGSFLDSKSLSVIFDIFLEKNANENLRSLIFAILKKTLKRNLLNIGPYMDKYVDYILTQALKFNIQVQYQSLELLLTIIQFNPELFKKRDSKFIFSVNETLLNTTTENSLIPIIFEILNKLYSIVKFDSSNSMIIEKTFLKTIEIIDSRPDFNSTSLLDFMENSMKLLDQKKSIQLLDSIINLSSSTSNLNKAKCISIIASFNSQESNVVNKCLDELKKKIDDEQVKWVLLCLGETCFKSKDSFSKVYEIIEKMLLSIKDELKASVAVCLGKIAVGNLETFISSLNTAQKELIGYYFISVRECLNLLSEKCMTIQLKSNENIKLIELFKILLEHTKHKEEKVRLLSGESLGLLALVSENLLEELIKVLANDKDLDGKAAALYSLKYIFSTKKYNDSQLKVAFESLIKSLKDSNLSIRSMGYAAMVNFAYNYSEVIVKMNYLDFILEAYEDNCMKKKELVEEIDLGGGVKITNDKGLPIRKSVFSTLKIFLDQIPERLKFEKAIGFIIKGLDDNEDIQNITFPSLMRLANITPSAFVSVIESLIDIFEKYFKKYSSNESKEDSANKKLYTYCEEIQRFLVDISKVEEIDVNPKFNELKYGIENCLASIVLAKES